MPWERNGGRGMQSPPPGLQPHPEHGWRMGKGSAETPYRFTPSLGMLSAEGHPGTHRPSRMAILMGRPGWTTGCRRVPRAACPRQKVFSVSLTHAWEGFGCWHWDAEQVSLSQQAAAMGRGKPFARHFSCGLLSLPGLFPPQNQSGSMAILSSSHLLPPPMLEMDPTPG